MKAMIIAFSAAALIVAAPAVFAQSAPGKTPHQHHQVSTKHPRSIRGYASWHAMDAKGLKTSYPRAFGYAPIGPKDYTLENSRQAGGGGGGSGM